MVAVLEVVLMKWIRWILWVLGKEESEVIDGIRFYPCTFEMNEEMRESKLHE